MAVGRTSVSAFGGEVSALRFREVVEGQLRALGWTAVEDWVNECRPTDVQLLFQSDETSPADEQAWVYLSAGAGVARQLAVPAARALSADLGLFVVDGRAEAPGDALEIELTPAAFVTRADGEVTPRALPRAFDDAVCRYQDDDARSSPLLAEDLQAACTEAGSVALTSLLEADSVKLSDMTATAVWWRPPSPQRSPRLTAILEQIEAGARWSVGEMAGQRMLRLERTDGSQMSSLSEEEWATVEDRFGGSGS